MAVFGPCSATMTKSGANNNTITKSSNGYSSAYGLQWTESTARKSVSWDITLNKCYSSSKIMFGIAPNQHHGSTDKGIYEHTGCYCVKANGFCYVKTKGVGTIGHELGAGETLTLTLNLREARLESRKNGETKVLVSNVKTGAHIKYRFAMSLFYGGGRDLLTVTHRKSDDEEQKTDDVETQELFTKISKLEKRIAEYEVERSLIIM